MCASKHLAGERHCSLITSIALLKLWLALRNETDDLYRSCPSMLNKSAVLNFDVKAGKRSSGVRVDVVLVYVMDSSITSVLRTLDVVVLVRVVPQLVIEPGFVEG